MLLYASPAPPTGLEVRCAAAARTDGARTPARVLGRGGAGREGESARSRPVCGVRLMLDLARIISIEVRAVPYADGELGVAERRAEEYFRRAGDDSLDTITMTQISKNDVI